MGRNKKTRNFVVLPMQKPILLLVLLLGIIPAIGQTLSPQELLNKAIAYHDPNGNWPSFNDSFSVSMATPQRSTRTTLIHINLPEARFTAAATQDGLQTTYSVINGQCQVRVSDPDAQVPDCQRAVMYKDYYTYLYGLPMKLKDPGTILPEAVLTKTFKGKEYLVLKVSYDAAVGSDVWFFYFDPITYAMEVYQFYKGDPAGDGKDTGEYILLSDVTVVNDIKMPKVRAWYYNKDNVYLGTDTLKD